MVQAKHSFEEDDERESFLKKQTFEIDHESSFSSKQTSTNLPKSNSVSMRRFCCISSLVIASIIWLTVQITKRDSDANGTMSLHINNEQSWKTSRTLPTELIKRKFKSGGVYEEGDFENEEGRKPPYWYDIQVDENYEGHEVQPSEDTLPHWGPCYKPSRAKLMAINWEIAMQKNRNITSEKDIRYPNGAYSNRHVSNNDVQGNLKGLCRPGFLIIGAGKCGTSSLYHYLVDHPRVVPAKTKQIHYFKYHTSQTMEWYLNYFPGAETFLSSGALMTGEASPGYLPYPDVAHRIRTWIPDRIGNYETTSNHTEKKGDLPRIITIVRNPLERAYSSYKYNYVQPALDKIKRKKHLKKGEEQPDEYYIEKNLFSFEELIMTELDVLKECLKPNGVGETKTASTYRKRDHWRPEFERRAKEGLPGLIAIDEHCYGNQVSSSVPRRQWEGLVKDYPDKIIKVPNIFLVQSLIGRSLYTFPLEWWYAIYPKEDLYIVCNEDLKHDTANTMSKLSDFLGLPKFNFTEAVSAGMYNVGDNRGYDKPTKWDSQDTEKTIIPISNKLRKEFLSFVQSYNERLFELTGRRCNW